MHFRTQPSWELKDPIFNGFEDPENPSFMWRAVELPLAVYYYHLHIAPDPNNSDSVGVDIILGEFNDALETLRIYPGSEDYSLWLDTQIKDPSKLQHLYKPLPIEMMVMHRVTEKMNSPKFNGPACIKPL